jgi:hypothetical protein
VENGWRCGVRRDRMLVDLMVKICKLFTQCGFYSTNAPVVLVVVIQMLRVLGSGL